jgi:hypothetical protein
MGFIFRTVFWLGLAMVVLPPQARLGGDDTASLRDINVSAELKNLTTAAWALGDQALRTCETNPGLCKAGQDLVDSAATAAGTVATDLQNRWQAAAGKPRQVAEAQPHRPKKIQARVE